jgi:hypothetical protein
MDLSGSESLGASMADNLLDFRMNIRRRQRPRSRAGLNEAERPLRWCLRISVRRRYWSMRTAVETMSLSARPASFRPEIELLGATTRVLIRNRELPGRRQLPAERSGAGWVWWFWSGGGFEGDFVAEGFELPDVGVLAAFRADPAVVVAGTEVGIAGVGIG